MAKRGVCIVRQKRPKEKVVLSGEAQERSATSGREERFIVKESPSDSRVIRYIGRSRRGSRYQVQPRVTARV
jgi:hypothetical protein